MILNTMTRLVEPDITVVEVSGRMNLGFALSSLEASIKRLIEAGTRKLVIDLSSLDAIDSSGIGLLVSCSGEIEQVGGRMRIGGAHGSVAKALDVAHLDRITPIDSDTETACRQLAAEGAGV